MTTPRAAAVLAVACVLLAGCSSGTDAAAPASTAPAATGSAVAPSDRQASEEGPRIVEVRNGTDRYMELSVGGVDNFDWEGHRPDHRAPEGFQGTGLAGYSSTSRALSWNFSATSAPWILRFGDTGASVELDLAQDSSQPVVGFGYDWGGWGVRGERWCGTNTVTKGAYTIKIQCKGVYSYPNTLVEITKTGT